MKTASLAVGLLLAVSLPAEAVDPMWLRNWEMAQQNRPRTIGKIGRIAPVKEPGTPLVVRGQILNAEGKPAVGVIVFAYQTDRTGVYNAPRTPGYRLRGWAKSGADGRFEFHTVRPGSYPGTRNPAHIHFTIEGPGIERRWTHDVQFADDPVAERKDETFLPVTVRDGVQYVDYTVRIEERGRF